MDTTGNVVFDQEVTSAMGAVSSIATGSILVGDTDGWYTVIARHVYDTADSTLNLTFNADTTAANYGYRGITANNTTVANVNSTSATIRLCAVASGTTTGFSIFTLYAKQGAVRLGNGINVCNINGTTVTQLETLGSVWNNTNTQITNMVFTPSAGKIGVGGRVIILKGNANAVGSDPDGSTAWHRVGSSVLGSAASSVTFSGLNGDAAVLYYVSSQIKGGYAGTAQPVLLPNNATTNTVYGYQRLTWASTTVAAGRITTGFIGFHLPYYTANTNYTMNTNLIFAKSGFVRPDISLGCSDISGTTVTRADIYGDVWNNTSDNITSLVITTDKANGLATGSQFDLYALYGS